MILHNIEKALRILSGHVIYECSTCFDVQIDTNGDVYVALPLEVKRLFHGH